MQTNYTFVDLPEIEPHMSVKTFLRYMGAFWKLMCFHEVYFVLCNFNLPVLKVNGNAPSDEGRKATDV